MAVGRLLVSAQTDNPAGAGPCNGRSPIRGTQTPPAWTSGLVGLRDRLVAGQGIGHHRPRDTRGRPPQTTATVLGTFTPQLS